MNALVGDSRVRSFKLNYLSELSDNWSLPGAGVRKMEDLIQDCIIMHHGEDYCGKMHIYISAGLCDLTTRLKTRHYEEIIFETVKCDEIKLQTKASLQHIHQFAIKEDVIPIFTTIYPMSLNDWNMNRLHQNKTSYLNYQDDYISMQNSLQALIEDLNKFIVQLNLSIGMTTPLIHKHLVHYRGKGNTTYKLNLLIDGCHPCPTLMSNIANSISQAIKKNRK